MGDRVEHITIVGGGTAGWLTATILSRFLNASREGPAVAITVIESPKVPTVGVGEATVAGMARLLAQLGIDESEFFRHCNASFKLAVRFDNWALDRAGMPISFLHPFNYPPFLGGVPAAYHFNRFGPFPGYRDLAECLVPNSAVIGANKGPRRLGARDYDYGISYAYHLDASLFGRFLCGVATGRGIRHIRDDVVEVLQDERGFVSALRLEQGGLLPVDFVVDCTGFRGLIIREALEEPFESFDNLLCDRAIPVQIPHLEERRLPPCTRSSGLGAGWVWRVPLYSRLGTGYVFSSAFRSDEAAAAEFFEHLRAVGDLPQDAPDPDTRVIHMKVGQTRRSWVKNCVAIGLSGGFIEPLESTAIYMIEMAARWLVGYLPNREVNPVFAQRFNMLMNELYAEVRDFILAHYYTSNRPEPFWRAARDEIEVPESLRQNLALWRHVLPNNTDTEGCRLFNYWNYIYILWPKGHFEDAHFPLEGSIARRDWEAFGRKLAHNRDALMATLPNHYDLLAQIRRAEPIPAGGFGAPSGPRRQAETDSTAPAP